MRTYNVRVLIILSYLMPNKKNKKFLKKKRQNRSNGKMKSSQPGNTREVLSTMPLIERRLNVFPMRHRATLRYHDVIDLGITGVTPIAYVFSANGLYDPDLTGTGHQPMGFDQLMAFFNHYVVMSSRIKVEMVNSDATQNTYAALSVQRGSSPLNVWNRIIEEGNVTHTILGCGQEAGGPIPPRLTRSVRIADFQSVPNVLNDDTLRGSASTNPSTVVSFMVYTYAQGTTSGHISASVTLEYDAWFIEPVQVAQS